MYPEQHPDSWPSLTAPRSKKRTCRVALTRWLLVILVLGGVYLVNRSRPATQIAFTVFTPSPNANTDIYLVNDDGSNLRKLTQDYADDTSPIWSPDGRRIAFVSDRGTPTRIRLFVMNADGSDLHALPEHNDLRPAMNGTIPHGISWSPDSEQLAFACGWSGNESICVINVDSGDIHSLTGNQARDLSPAWSPDGRQIAFSSGQRQSGSYNIMVMLADGSNLHYLTETAANDRGPVWSPDGRQIAFVSDRDGNSEVYVIEADGSNPTNLTKSSGDDIEPAWSPDGRQIAFVSDRDGDPEIFAMDADGNHQRNLTNNDTWDHSPVWVSEGGRIAFTSGQYYGKIYLMNDNGSKQRCLTCPGNNWMDNLCRFLGWNNPKLEAIGFNSMPAARP